MSANAPIHQPAWLDVHQPSLGRYVLGPVLGQGGAGEVREAWDVVLCRTVALKILRKMEPVGLIRFMHEAQIQSRIAHPNICRIYDVDNSGGIPKIAMQLVRGPTLAQAAAELTVKETVTILAQVAEAIHAAHRLNLIHRDLKPSNILLERNDEGQWVPFVCDFGLAMVMDEPSLTLGPGLIGTPAFMAPEQILGQRQLVGPATDVFALGGTLHYALFGDAPSPVGGKLDIRRQGVFPPSRAAHPDLPLDLETILRKCLEPDPDLRYESAMALAEDLWLFHDDAPIRARPVGPLQHRWRQLRQYRTLALVAFLAAAGVLMGRLVEMGRLTREQQTRAEWERFFVLEAADLEKELRLEKMLPIHDMRPTYARLRLRMEGIRARMQALGAAAQGPGHYALGRANFMLNDYAKAQRELEQAWSLGFQGPEVAYLLARSLVAADDQATNPFIFRVGLQPSPSASVAERAQALFQLGKDEDDDSTVFAQALTAYALKDFRKAAACAHASFTAHPWRYEAATIESLSLSALGQQQFDAGDLAGAETSFRSAMAAAQQFLVLGQSDEFTHHAYLIAARHLGFLAAGRGRLSLAFINAQKERCQRAMNLDPGQPWLQDDWLSLCMLKALRLRELGRDNGPELVAGLIFLDARAEEPLAVELQADRMLLYWRLAERDLARGRDPRLNLGEALKNLGHTAPFKHRDYLCEVLNFKAMVEARQGKDPRPTLADALDRVSPLLARGPSWTLSETAAESWLLRAHWEAEHGLDAQASLRRSRALVDGALRINGQSGSGHAIKGLAEMLEARLSQGKRSLLLGQAREHLRLAQRLDPEADQLALLQRTLAPE